MQPTCPLVSVLLLLLWMEPEVMATEIMSEPSPSDLQTAGLVPSSGSGDLRDALAKVVIERNEAASQRDSLQQQYWLVIGYALVASLLALWFLGSRWGKASPKPKVVVAPSGVRTGAAPTKRRTNATITIRNAVTQQPELVEQVSTRRFFRTRPQPAAKGTDVVPLAPAPAQPVRTVVDDYHPSDVPDRRRPAGGTSILLPPLMTKQGQDVVPELVPDPPTTQVGIARSEGRDLVRSGLSLLEVMIALAVLAIVMSSVGSGISQLSAAKRQADEESTVATLLRGWSERIVGAEWEWLGQDQIDDPSRGAWSWPRMPSREGVPVAGSHPPLTEGATDPLHDAGRVLLDGRRSGLADLRCHLEYYRPLVVELCFVPAPGVEVGAWCEEVRPAHRLSPPIDLRQHLDAVVVHLSATWRARDGGQRQRELIFVRTR